MIDSVFSPDDTEDWIEASHSIVLKWIENVSGEPATFNNMVAFIALLSIQMGEFLATHQGMTESFLEGHQDPQLRIAAKDTLVLAASLLLERALRQEGKKNGK